MKKCSHCKKQIALNNFWKSKSKKDGLHDQCINCQKQYYLINKKKILKRYKKYYLKHRDKELNRCKKYNNSSKRKDTVSNKLYKVSISDMLEWQNYKCAICQEKENNRKLSVDHSHRTGQIRMLLCNGCNLGTKITDNQTLCYAKGQYLEAYL